MDKYNTDEENISSLQERLDNLRNDHDVDNEPIDELVDKRLLNSTLAKLRENETLKLRDKINKMESKIQVLENENSDLKEKLTSLQSKYNEKIENKGTITATCGPDDNEVIDLEEMEIKGLED